MARRAGVSKGVVTYHFAAKADLIQAVISDVIRVAYVLRHGQEQGRLGSFDAQVMAAVIKAALDDLLLQFADDPGSGLEAYGAEMAAMFERATRTGPEAGPPPATA